jgi:glyoxylase-like metal-dependent hydrolase (beta-lactamase superfamily II)
MANPRVSEVVSDVYIVPIGRGAFSTNVYLIRSGSSWTLVDAGWFGSEKKIGAAAESVFVPRARPASMVLTHLHLDHSGATRRLAEHWGEPAYVHPDEVPLAAGYQEAYAIPLDRWLVPLIRLPKKTQAKIAGGADLTAVVKAFDPQIGIPGLPGWEAIHTPGHTPGSAWMCPRRHARPSSGRPNMRERRDRACAPYTRSTYRRTSTCNSGWAAWLCR